jgi:3-phosphoglycerate kinase
MKMADAKAKTIIGGGDTVAVAHSLHLLKGLILYR